MNNKMTHQNTLLTQTQMCPKGFDDEQRVHDNHNTQTRSHFNT